LPYLQTALPGIELVYAGRFIDQIKDMEFCGIGFNLVWSDEIDPVRKVILPPQD
jgi:hypothetical protein